MSASYAEGVAAMIECPDLHVADLRKAELTRRSLREPLPPEPYWRVAQYADTIENAWDDDERYRMLISDLPRRFHQSSRGRQEHALAAAPRLTGTKWDSLLAAVAEHIAICHDHPVPDWCDAPERFLKIYWMPLPVFGKGFPGMVYRDTPGAFLRHGVLVADRELGDREGHRDYGALFDR